MNIPDFFESVGRQTFKCLLCPHSCVLKPGMRGFCGVRTADGQGIHAPSHPVSVMAIDPVEKKPFYHFLPGTQTLSIGFAGCNLQCPFCQNHSLVESRAFIDEMTPQHILEEAMKLKIPSVSFTYSEPLIHIEFLIETASLLKKNGISPLLITNGCINREPGKGLLACLDGVKVDLKSFDASWYEKELKGSLDAVKNFITEASRMTHLEVVTLVIPEKNDSVTEIEEAAEFLSSLNKDIPYHLTAYYPMHHYRIPPTTLSKLEILKRAAESSLHYVYTGNTRVREQTLCSACSSLVIDRLSGITYISKEGKCIKCGNPVYGCFS